MAIADEILDLENRFWQTMISRDVDTATALTAESCIITGAQGVSQIDKATMGKMLAGGQWKLLDYSFDEVKVVAPLRPESTLDLFTGDIDDAKVGAEERAAGAAAESESAEAVTNADPKVGDADQLLAIGDALAEFEADRIVLVDADDEELAPAVRERYGLPVTELSAG